MDQPLCHVVTPVGMLGYGFDEALTAAELARLVPTRVPTAMILDSGSTDSGPEKLALGGMTCPRSAYLKDLTKMIRLVRTFRVPLIFASAGGDGSDEHVRVMGEIIADICAEEENQNSCFKTISIFSGIDKTTIVERLRDGRISPCGTCVPQLTRSQVESSPHVVAQIGFEPFVDAMEADPDFDILIGGRAYDPAPYVAYCATQLRRQFPKLASAEVDTRYGGFYHMGKIMECGGQCSTPKTHGAISTVYPDGKFDVRPLAPESRCTPYSVAAHALYENTRPDILRGPGGELHLKDSQYDQLQDGRTVRVSGSQYKSSRSEGKPYCLKLEAAHVIGHRSVFMGSVRDYILIGQLDKLLKKVRWYVGDQHPDLSGQWKLDFHVYGKGQTTPSGPGEVFIVAEVIAPTQLEATSLASKARVAMIHGPYPNQKATSGNFAFGIGGKMELEMGPCAEFSLYHLMELSSGEERLGGELIHSTVNIFGQGQPLVSSDDFKASVAQLQDTFPIPAVTNGKTSSANVINASDSGENPPVTLSDVCRVLRSKNAGPYEITMDAIFDTESAYQSVKTSNLLSRANVARALKVSEEDIVWMGFSDAALAFKVTIPRFRGGKMTSAGSFMENDVHGSQQHTGLGSMMLQQGRRGGVLADDSVMSLIKPMMTAQTWYKMGAVLAALWGVSTLTAMRHLFSRFKGS